ncbi:MAG TPA: hypothetical protein VNQ76_21005, partial [Planctomicrobium sp.]|nr:hypothetical protein [Planctomicrobium sp.]
MRPVLAASILTALFACFGANEIACAQTSNFRIDEFQLPIQSSPPFTRPLGPPARRELESEYVGTWTTGVHPQQIQQTVNSVDTQSFETRSLKTTDTLEVAESQKTVTRVQFVEPAMAPPALPPQPIPALGAPALPP